MELPEERDHEIVAKVLQGNQKAFADLIERFHGTAYAVVRGVLGDRDDVEDVLQHVYIKIYKGLGSFRGDAKLSTWIYQIARNEAINAVRRRQLPVTPLEDVELSGSPADGPEHRYDKQQVGRNVERAMAELDDNYRIALELRYMGERSYEEIADMMGLPLGTVKTYIHRGKAELKKVLTRQNKAVPLHRGGSD